MPGQHHQAAEQALAGIRPVAMAPITVPMKNRVSSEEKAKVAPKVRCILSPSTSLRKAKPAPPLVVAAAAVVCNW